jgi:hypothetical protein
MWPNFGSDWYGPECSCCGGSIYYRVSNPARPLCHGCQVDPLADEIVRLIVTRNTFEPVSKL